MKAVFSSNRAPSNFVASGAFETTSSVAFFAVDRPSAATREQPRIRLGRVVGLPRRQEEVGVASSSSLSDSDVPPATNRRGSGTQQDPMYVLFGGNSDDGQCGDDGEAMGGGLDDLDGRSTSLFTSVSHRRALPQSTVANSYADCTSDGPSDAHHLDPLLREDPVLQRLYRSQKKRLDQRHTSPAAPNPGPRFPYSAARQAADARVEALIAQKMRSMGTTVAHTSAARARVEPMSTRPTMGHPHPHHDVALHDRATGETVATGSGDLTVRERWKVLSAHYKRVTETFSPTRSARRGTSGCLSPHLEQHRQGDAPTDTLASSVYAGYVSPIPPEWTTDTSAH